jgi:hypothetical protein
MTNSQVIAKIKKFKLSSLGDFQEKFKLEEIGGGCFRKTYKIGGTNNFVVKFPMGISGKHHLSL